MYFSYFSFVLPQIIEVFKSIFNVVSISSQEKLDDAFFLEEVLQPHQKNCSKISHKSTSTHPKPHHEKGFPHQTLQYVSYSLFFVESDKTEYASFTSLNFSASHHLSGWCSIAFFLYAFFISSSVAHFESPNIL